MGLSPHRIDDSFVDGIDLLFLYMCTDLIRSEALAEEAFHLRLSGLVASERLSREDGFKIYSVRCGSKVHDILYQGTKGFLR